MEKKIDSLADEILSQTGKSWLDGAVIKTSEAPRPKELQDKTNRAFRHALSEKFLCESGQVKFHQASGHRSSLVLIRVVDCTVQHKTRPLYMYTVY